MSKPFAYSFSLVIPLVVVIMVTTAINGLILIPLVGRHLAEGMDFLEAGISTNKTR